MSTKQGGKGGGARKIGRNADWCKQYKASGTLIINKMIAQCRHIIKHHRDIQPNTRIQHLSTIEKRQIRDKLRSMGGLSKRIETLLA